MTPSRTERTLTWLAALALAAGAAYLTFYDL